MEALQLSPDEIQLIEANRAQKKELEQSKLSEFELKTIELKEGLVKEMDNFLKKLGEKNDWLSSMYMNLTPENQLNWKLGSKVEEKTFSDYTYIDEEKLKIEETIKFSTVTISRGDIKIIAVKKYSKPRGGRSFTSKTNHFELEPVNLYDNQKNCSYLNINTLAKRVQEYAIAQENAKKAAAASRTLLQKATETLEFLFPKYKVSVEEEEKFNNSRFATNTSYRVITGKIELENGLTIFLSVDKAGISIKSISGINKMEPIDTIHFLAKMENVIGATEYNSAKILIND